MTGTILLITDYLFSLATTIVATAVVAGTFAVFWYALPLWRRAHHDDDEAEA